MEGLGAASAVLELGKAAWQISSALYRLHQDTKHINETINDLNREVKALATACDTIHGELKEVVGRNTSKPSLYDRDGRLWQRIIEQTKECDTTLQKLGAIVGDIQEEGSNVFSQGKRQIKLNSRKEDLVDIRSRLHSHTESLHTILLVMNIKIAHLAPGLANQELVRKVGDLQTCIQNLQSRVQTAPQSLTVDNSVTLIDYAKDVVQSGVTLYEASVAGGSVVGGANAATANTRVAAWLNSFESLRKDAHPSEPSDDMGSRTFSVFSGDDGRTLPTDPTSAHDSRQLDDNDDFGDDSDVELSTEIIESAMRDGAKAFEKEDWLEAELLYEEALQQLHQLSAQHRPPCDTFELQFKLAVCVYHTKSPEEAEHALTGLMQQSMASLSETQTGYICNAGHMLSILYVRMGKLETARSTCERTLKTKTRMLGRGNDSRLESLALMARVYQLLGNQTREKIFLGMIPEERRSSFWAPVRNLGVLSSSQAAPTQIAGSSVHDDANVSVSTLALIDPEAAGGILQRTTSDPSGLVLGASTEEGRPPFPTTPRLARSPDASNKPSSGSDEMIRGGAVEILPESGSVAGISARSMSEPMVLPSQASLSVEEYIEDQISSPTLASEPEVPAETATLPSGLHTGKRMMPLTREARTSEDTQAGGLTPLHFAALFGDLDVAQALVDAGADPLAEAKYEGDKNLNPPGLTLTPFGCALGGRRVALVKWFVPSLRQREGSGLTFECWPLLSGRWLATTSCDDANEIIDMLQALLDLGQWKSTVWNYERYDGRRQYRHSLLHQACRIPENRSHLREPVVKFLMEAKMDVLLTTIVFDVPHGLIPLHYAIENGAAEVVPLLLQHSKIEQLEMGVDKSGDSLHFAVERAAADPKMSLNIVEQLLQAGANPHNQTCIDKAPLFSRRRKMVYSSPQSVALDSPRGDLKSLMSKYPKNRFSRFRWVDLYLDKDTNLWKARAPKYFSR